MTPQQEEEWLTYVAAGIDPLVALAALPPDNAPEKQIRSEPRSHRSGCLALMVVILIVVWFALCW